VNYLAFVKGKPSPDARLVNSQIEVVELRLTQFLMPMLYPEISKIFRSQFQLPGNLCPDSSHADYDKESAPMPRSFAFSLACDLASGSTSGLTSGLVSGAFDLLLVRVMILLLVWFLLLTTPTTMPLVTKVQSTDTCLAEEQACTRGICRTSVCSHPEDRTA
jgi:hypothetical protein